ncbi:tetratricopeptide repeat protein, partial [Crocinitomicaceae bacterium]|nr:tetratricopeptide repeat protein [Crocinitomicaceae bacterium]
AISDYTRAIEIDNQYFDAYHSRGIVKGDLGDVYGGISDITRAIEINPKFAMAYFNRAILKERLNDKNGACKDAKIAKKLGLVDDDPNFVNSFCN